MLSYDDPKWKELKGGYKTLYNPTVALQKLERAEKIEDAWEELSNKLHHQGDVGEASYAAVPHLVRIQKEKRSFDWNFYALISIIEVERRRTTNPPLPEWLRRSYEDAWSTVLDLGLDDLKWKKDKLNIRAILGAIALAKGLNELGAFITTIDESELVEYLDEHLEWSELYR
jgi:hypothetical protein